MNYKDITVEEAEMIYRMTGCTLICDADKSSTTIEGELMDNIKSIFKSIGEAIKQIAECIVKAFESICEYINALFNKRIGKKRFMKLLQSKGIQRNQIKELVKDNKEKYTLFRYITTIPPY